MAAEHAYAPGLGRREIDTPTYSYAVHASGVRCTYRDTVGCGRVETCGPGRRPLWFRNLACATLASATAFHRWLALALVLRNYAHALAAPTRCPNTIYVRANACLAPRRGGGGGGRFEGTLSVGARPAAG